MKLSALPATPGVSVIVNTLNRMGSLENTLLGLRQLRYPDVEIIVVHGPCTDETLALLERHREFVRIAACPIMNLSVSRNIGLRLAAKDLVAFIDDDAVPEPDWLDRLVTGFSDPEVAAVGGFIRDQDGVAYQHQIIVANRLGDGRSCTPPAPPLSQGDYFSPTGTNICVRRDCLMRIGGFDEAFTYFLEETDVNLRLVDRGWTIGFVPDAEVHHYFLANEVRNRRRVPRSLYQLARSKAYFCWKHGPGHVAASEINRRLARYRAQLRRNLVWFRLTRQLSLADARKLRVELDRGLADGEQAAQRAPSAAAQFADAPPGDRLRTPERRRDRSGRVCWISGPGNALADGAQCAALPLELARLGNEVTAISPAAGTKTAIRFDGVWRHRVGSGAPKSRAFWRRYGAAALYEVERIQPRRCFDIVLCPHDLEGALSPLSARGVEVLATSSTLTAHDLNALIRSALAAQG